MTPTTLYVAFGSKLSKIGITRRFDSRKKQLAIKFRKHGDELVEMSPIGVLYDFPGRAERWALHALSIEVLRRPIHGTEWYEGVSRDLVRRVAMDAFDVELRAEKARWARIGIPESLRECVL